MLKGVGARRAVVVATAATLSLGLAAHASLAADTTATPTGVARQNCAPTNCFFYNAMAQVATATGVTVSFTVAQPKVGTKDYHSLTELAVESADQNQAIELGWMVSKSDFHDSLPHLFTDQWIDGLLNCENICGFVRLPNAIKAGSVLKPGPLATFSVQFKTNKWFVSYNGVPFGYFPESFWHGKFTKIGKVQAFGEVHATTSTTPHSQMGNGILGTKPGAAIIKNFKLIGGTATKPFTYYADAPYKIGHYVKSCVTNCGMTFGGPGD